MARLIYAALLALSLTCTGRAIGAPHAPDNRPKACKKTKWRYIHGERVPWDHDEDDHGDDDEWEHSVDECEPPPC